MAKGTLSQKSCVIVMFSFCYVLRLLFSNSSAQTPTFLPFSLFPQAATEGGRTAYMGMLPYRPLCDHGASTYQARIRYRHPAQRRRVRRAISHVYAAVQKKFRTGAKCGRTAVCKIQRLKIPYTAKATVEKRLPRYLLCRWKTLSPSVRLFLQRKARN